MKYPTGIPTREIHRDWIELPAQVGNIRIWSLYTWWIKAWAHSFILTWGLWYGTSWQSLHAWGSPALRTLECTQRASASDMWYGFRKLVWRGYTCKEEKCGKTISNTLVIELCWDAEVGGKRGGFALQRPDVSHTSKTSTTAFTYSTNIRSIECRTSDIRHAHFWNMIGNIQGTCWIMRGTILSPMLAMLEARCCKAKTSYIYNVCVGVVKEYLANIQSLILSKIHIMACSCSASLYVLLRVFWQMHICRFTS